MSVPRMADSESTGPVLLMPSGHRPVSGTVTKRAITSVIVQDYRDVCREFDVASKQLRDLARQRTEIELIAEITGVELRGGALPVD